ncbi:hypothetical protein [Bacillus sp. OK048]|nr:hypothetical protein [Bacillus sp. OK048]
MICSFIGQGGEIGRSLKGLTLLIENAIALTAEDFVNEQDVFVVDKEGHW